MKMFVVPIHTQGLLIGKDFSQSFTTRTELAFDLEEVEFDPVTVLNHSGSYSARIVELAMKGLYGFGRCGPSGQKYTLIVSEKNVNIL